MVAMNLSDVVRSIENEFLIFSFGENYIDETLDKFPFDQEGMQRLWDWYDHLSQRVLEFLDQRFLELGQRGCSAICHLQLSQIREKITAIQSEFDCYTS